MSEEQSPHSLERIAIRYEGKDAERHAIDMMALGESLQGFGRIYSVVGHFVATGNYAKQWQALSVRAFATEPQAKCFQLAFDLQSVLQSQIFSGLAGSIIASIVAYVVARNSNKGEEMRHLRELLEKQLDAENGRNSQITERLLGTIEKMAESLRAPLKQAVAPIGTTCGHIDVCHGTSSQPALTIDQATKDAILADSGGDELTPETEFSLVITELDKERSTAKVRLINQLGEPDEADEENQRISALITDPAFSLADNAYLRHFASGKAMRAKGKAVIRDDGTIKQVYLSDSLE